jgi:hypothetical protein
MKINAFLVLVWGCLWGHTSAERGSQHHCSSQVLGMFASNVFFESQLTHGKLPCIVELVPEFCNSLTNLTCVCTDPKLTLALKGCALAACNVTESLELENYKAQTCKYLSNSTFGSRANVLFGRGQE